MHIETRPLIFQNPADYHFYGKTKTGTGAAGLCKFNNIYLIPRAWDRILGTYCHEIGHLKGSIFSFIDGAVLTPGECKKTSIALNLEEKAYIVGQNRLFPQEPVKMEGILLDLSNNILQEFFKGNFNPKTVILHNISVEDMREAVGEHFSYPNSRRARNMELEAYITQIGCLRILENSLHKLGIKKDLLFPATKSPGHQRAINIVARSYQETHQEWNLPSSADLRGQKVTIID